MNSQDLKLYSLLGGNRKKCVCVGVHPHSNLPIAEFVEDEPTIADFHKWLGDRYHVLSWIQKINSIEILDINPFGNGDKKVIHYSSSLTLLNQSSETKQQIIDLIESIERGITNRS